MLPSPVYSYLVKDPLHACLGGEHGEIVTGLKDAPQTEQGRHVTDVYVEEAALTTLHGQLTHQPNHMGLWKKEMI